MRAALKWPCVCIVLAGCAENQAQPLSHTVTDSAGITIVQSARPAWGEAERWTIAAEPQLQIGSVEGEEPYLLNRMVGVARLEDGRVAVAVGGDNTIRFYDGQGQYLSRVGGSGEGPGEFAQLRALLRTPGRLYGRQSALRPIHVFDESSGAFIESISPPDMPGFRSGIWEVFDDGSVVLRSDPEGTPPASGVFTQTSTVVRVTPDGLIDTLGVFPTRASVRMNEAQWSAQQFGPGPMQTYAGDRFYRGYTSDYEIAEFALDGSVRTLIRRAWEPRPVTDEDVERRKDEFRSMGSDEDQVNAMIYPDHHPAFALIRVDRGGNLWVQRQNPRKPYRAEVLGLPDDDPAPWDVFSPEGVWLGTVETPARFRILEFGEDYLAGVWTDELDIQYVRFHEIVKPAG